MAPSDGAGRSKLPAALSPSLSRFANGATPNAAGGDARRARGGGAGRKVREARWANSTADQKGNQKDAPGTPDATQALSPSALERHTDRYIPRPQPHTEETRRKISDSVKRSFADRRSAELRAGNLEVLQRDVSTFQSDLRKYKWLRSELRPFMDKFMDREGRSVTLWDMEETGLPWLITSYKRYMVLRERVVKQTLALRSDLREAEAAGVDRKRSSLLGDARSMEGAASQRGVDDNARRLLARALRYESAQERAHEYRQAIQAKNVEGKSAASVRSFLESRGMEASGGGISSLNGLQAAVPSGHAAAADGGEDANE